ncbi:MAG TPA: AraC family transcriptional regulator [Gemmatimonadaceae bacterium]|nr:AraC family transcriptional regulator [Gemmatimonadaceae bacterium]
MPISLVAYAPRERMRGILRAAFPRRRCRLALTRAASEFARVFRSTLVDAAVIDVAVPNEDLWHAAALARDYPSIPFFALTPLRAADAPAVARCVALDFADILTEHVDDAVLRDLVLPLTFTHRFQLALSTPPPELGLTTHLRRAVWEQLVAHAGRPVRTDTVARALSVSREHLSRTFAADGGANLKRTIDLVRLLAAAELAKNPGYDVGDVARVLGFASSSHLSTASQRICGTKPASLARLRAIDIIERFVQGRRRSRT